MVRAVLFAGITLAAASGAMLLQSKDFNSGGKIPQPLMAADCGGGNRSPELAWSAAPSSAKSFALIMHDADAPIAGGFYHWVVYDLPAGTHGLPAGAKIAAGRLGETSLDKPGYYGPCPPPGPVHHYTLTLYALDLARVSDAAPLTGAQLTARIEGHVIARATLEGIASHP